MIIFDEWNEGNPTTLIFYFAYTGKLQWSDTFLTWSESRFIQNYLEEFVARE